MLFSPGSIVATPAALRVCTNANMDPLSLIRRHLGGDFGELDAEDVQANVRALQHDLRILSAYTVGGVRLYIITEADRSSTCLLRADEY